MNNDPGPRGMEKMVPVHVVAVPKDAPPIESIDEFAMMVDLWHSQKFELANRLLNIDEGTIITIQEKETPDVDKIIRLEGDTLVAFRIGIEAALNLFKDLPFGASVEQEPSQDE